MDVAQQVFPNQLQQASYDDEQAGLREHNDVKTAPSSLVTTPSSTPILTFTVSPPSPSQLRLDLDLTINEENDEDKENIVPF